MEAPLVERLLEKRVQVRCLVRPQSNKQWIEHLNVEYITGDLKDPSSFVEAVQGVDIIYHLAGVTKAGNTRAFWRGNCLNTRNLLNICGRYGHDDQKVVFVSSQAVMGPSPNGMVSHEGRIPRPVSLYGKSKLLAEEAVRKFGLSRPATIIRLPTVYGPKDKDTLFLFKSVHRGVYFYPSGAAQLFSIIHVNDAVDGIILAAHTPISEGKVYILSADGEYTLHTIAGHIADALDKRPIAIPVSKKTIEWISVAMGAISRVLGKPVLLNRDKARDLMQNHWVCSNRKARDELGFRPCVGIREGVALTAAWYKQMNVL